MALAYTLLRAFQSGTDANVYVIPIAFTPPANQLLLLAVASNRNGAVPSVPTSITGHGLTWVPVDNQTFNPIATPVSRLLWYRSMHASPTSGQVTITFPETQQNCLAIMLAVSGTHLGGTHGSGAIGNIVKVVSNSTQTLGGTLSFASVTNGAVYAVAKSTTTGMAPKAGWSEVGEQGSASTDLRLQVQFIPTADTAPSCTWAPSAAAFAAGIAFEILEPGGAAAVLDGSATLALAATAELTTQVSDTDRARFAVMEWGLVWEPGLPYLPVGPTFTQAEQQTLLWGYPGVLWTAGDAGALTGTAVLALDATGALTTAIPLAGAASLALDATGELTTAIPLAGTAALVLDAAGTLTTAIALTGTATLALDATADIAGAAAALTGTASLALDASGTLTTAITPTGTAALALDATGALTTAIPLAGSATLALDATGDLTAGLGLTGTAVLALDATATLTTAIRMTGSATLALDATADLFELVVIDAWIDFVAPAPVMSFRGEAPRMAFRGRSPQVEFTGGG